MLEKFYIAYLDYYRSYDRNTVVAQATDRSHLAV